MKSTFLAVLCCWGFVSAWHMWRLWKRRHIGSLVVMVSPWGFVAYCAREAHLLSLEGAHWVTAAALVLGVSSAGLYAVAAEMELRRWWVDTEPMKRLRAWVKR